MARECNDINNVIISMGSVGEWSGPGISIGVRAAVNAHQGGKR